MLCASTRWRMRQTGSGFTIRSLVVFLLIRCTSAEETEPTPGPSPAPPSSVTAGMVLIPAGPFMMGCNEAVDSDCDPDEKPYHQVTLRAYEIDRLEVTFGDYQKCV